MTFIIAEVGSNWTNLQDCLDSIVSAKECGADAVKFQMYTHKELYGVDGEMPGELPREWIPKLHAKCQEVGIEFMCTAFSVEGYCFIDPYVKRHKVASAENTDKEILETVNKLGRPVLLSTGGTTRDALWDIFLSLNQVHTTLLYCVSAYPAKNVYLENLRQLEKITPFTGYSCHTDDWVTAFYAVHNYQADVIEKHFKLREMDSPDNPHSILPKDFTHMVGTIRDYKYGTKGGCYQIEEHEFVETAKRRYIPELGGYYRTKKP